MTTIFAYTLVIVLSQLAFTIGTFSLFPVGLTLAWLPMRLRTTIAGVLSGIVGVGTSVAFGYAVFKGLTGADSLTIGPFLASTIPLIIPILNDFNHYKEVKSARDKLIQTVAESRGENAGRTIGEQTQWGQGFAVIGEVAGLLIATTWFFNR